MKIITWSRNALGHDVVYLNAENKLTRRQFPASLTDEEVRAKVLNLPKPEKKVVEGKTIWRCAICGYEYEGEELPEDFICPICKHPASDFEKVIK